MQSSSGGADAGELLSNRAEPRRVSVLGSFLEWFGRQHLAVQTATSAVLFGSLFAIGVPTYGIAPAVLVGLVLIEHWWNG